MCIFSLEDSYDQVKTELDLHGTRDLKNFLHLCSTSRNVKFKLLDDRRKKIVVDDVSKIHGSLICGKFFDIFLQEAATDFTDSNGLSSNGIFKQVRIPLKTLNNF